MNDIDRVVSRILTESSPAVRAAHGEMEARQKVAAEKSAEDFRAWRVAEREHLRPVAETVATWLERGKEDGTFLRIDSALKALTTLPRWWAVTLIEVGKGREARRLLLDTSTGSLVYERHGGVVGYVRTERTRAASAVELLEFPASLLSPFAQLIARAAVEQVIVTQLEEAERLALEREGLSMKGLLSGNGVLDAPPHGPESGLTSRRGTPSMKHKQPKQPKQKAGFADELRRRADVLNEAAAALEGGETDSEDDLDDEGGEDEEE